jgi:hypothetical protein
MPLLIAALKKGWKDNYPPTRGANFRKSSSRIELELQPWIAELNSNSSGRSSQKAGEEAREKLGKKFAKNSKLEYFAL